MRKRVVFKAYHQHQATFLPQSLDELIQPDHLVRIVNSIIDGINLDPLMRQYKGGGTSSFHPRMMLKVWVYGYITKVHSCRTLAKALRENIPFMWLAGKQTPDFRTLNMFRSNRMKGIIDDVFKQVVMYCVEKEFIDLAVLYVDGTKIQANANRHKAVWKKNTERYKEKVLEVVNEVIKQVELINETENQKFGQQDLPECRRITDTQTLQNEIAEVSHRINEQQLSKLKKKELIKARRKLIQQGYKLFKYELQETLLGPRNSYVKTDCDATMMRSKDDQLLPCYNIQHSCQNQIIVHYSVSQNANDATAFKDHIDTLPEELRPKSMLGDSIYGTLINYRELNHRKIENYLMYPAFHREQKPKFSNHIFLRENFEYNSETDTYRCPNNQKLELIWTGDVILSDGSTTLEKYYQAKGCQACPFFDECCKGTGDRTIKVKPELENYKKHAGDNLKCNTGIALRKKRGVDVETPFGNIKHNQGHRRFWLRTKQKVQIEAGFIALAHNLKKIEYFLKKVA